MTNRRQLIDAVEITDTGIHVVRLKRIFDATSVSEFEKVLAYLLERKHYKIVVDLTQVEFVASAGWGAFTAEFRNVRTAGGDIRLAGMSADVQDVFFLLELDSFISAYDNVDEAIVSFETEASTLDSVKPPAKVDAQKRQSESKNVVTHDPPSHEIAAEEQNDDFDDNENEEPVAFEVTELFDPAHRPPVALASGEAKSNASQPESHVPAPGPEEDGWVISEEIEVENGELGAFEAEENLAAALPLPDSANAGNSLEEGVDAEQRSAESEKFAEEFSEHANTDSWPQQDKHYRMPSEPSEDDDAAFSSDEWPEAQAEENVALEDFELQDIHDPWILEEIDTLPEEDDFEAEEWGQPEAPEETTASRNNANMNRPATPGARHLMSEEQRKAQKQVMPHAPKGGGATAVHAQEIAAQAEVHPKFVVRAPESGVLGARPALADKVKAASQQPTMQDTQPAGRVYLESDHVDLIKRIVSDHPHYGPAMIQKYFETRLEPPVQVSRSTVYRWLKLAGLNTREQRLGYAGKASAD